MRGCINERYPGDDNLNVQSVSSIESMHYFTTGSSDNKMVINLLSKVCLLIASMHYFSTAASDNKVMITLMSRISPLIESIHYFNTGSSDNELIIILIISTKVCLSMENMH